MVVRKDLSEKGYLIKDLVMLVSPPNKTKAPSGGGGHECHIPRAQKLPGIQQALVNVEWHPSTPQGISSL